jgi:signal peptide peptidase SppA
MTKTLFGMIGIALGIFFVLLLFGGLFTGSPLQVLPPVQQKYTIEVRPDAQGQRKVLARTAPVLLVLDLEGVFGSRFLNAETLAEKLQESKEGMLKDRKIAGILLHINSPGGSLPDIDAMYRMVRSYAERNRIPVYAYTEGAALSGGYYLAAAAEKIYASPSALVGSIGVIMSPMMNVSETLKKLGVESITISSGEGKDRLNPVRPWKEGEEKPLEEISNFYYKQFVDIVAEGRDLEPEHIINKVQAGFYPSAVGFDLGLVDDADANMSKVLSELAKRAGIAGEAYQVVGMKRKINVFDDFFQERSILSGEMTHRLEIPGASEKWQAPLALHTPQ